MKLQIMYELFKQVNLPYNLRKDVKFPSCNIINNITRSLNILEINKMDVFVYYLIFPLLESKAEILDNKQKLTSVSFIPGMFKFLAIFLLIKLFSRKYISKHKKCFYGAETLSHLRRKIGNFDPSENEYLERVAFLFRTRLNQ